MSTLLGLGVAIIIGFLFGKLIELLKVPSVAGYIIAGLLLGKSVFNILDTDFINQANAVSDVALAIIAFSIGGELVFRELKKIGFRVVLIAVAEGGMAFLLVFGSMLLLKQSLPIALLLGAVASATAPAATVLVLNQYRCRGPLTSTLIAVVAIDDVICLMIYAIASSIAKVFVQHGESVNVSKMILGPLYEIGGSVALGIIIGSILILLLRFFSRNHEVLVVIVATIFITIGIANQFELSTLLSNMTIGIMIGNFSKRRLKAFTILESVTAPIYISFFVIAGARLDISLLGQVGIIGVVYTIARMVGKISGASIMSKLTKADPNVTKFLGFGLLSQIGVAVGLAIVVSHEFEGTNIGDIVITVLLATTIVTEIVGPLMTKYAAIKSGEAYSFELDEDE
jgi:Kef-type K+ transport system membrane component KefB